MFESPAVRKLLRLAIAEDLGAGDITSELTVPAGQQSRARLLAKEPLVMCGSPIIFPLFKELGWPIECAMELAEGQEAAAGTVLGRLYGETRHLLGAERILLNFLQHLCGIATRARRVVAEAHGLTVLDTRKTTPGWRALEKYAVRVGGARNHRGDLSEMVLVKDNHVDAQGGDLAAALGRVMAEKPYYTPVQVEARSMAELAAALAAGVRNVMLDNMNDAALAECLTVARAQAPDAVIEVSGRVRPEQFRRLKELGVTCVSTSTMVTDAVWADISMKLE